MAKINKIKVENNEYDIEDTSALKEVPSEYKTKAENDELYQAKGEYLTEETDPTVPSYVKNISENDIASWNNKSEFSGDYDDLTNKPDLTVYSLKTQTGSTLEMSINSTTYVMTVNLKDINNNVLSTQTVDLPLETMVVNADYDSVTKEIVLTLQSGATTRFSVADLVSGLQTEITTTNKLPSDLVDDTNATNKFVTSSEKTTWNGKQDTLVSGTNIKTINSTSVLGSGDITTEQVQYSTMPTAGTDNLGKIVQYTGATDSTYTQGHFYIVVSDGEATPTYSWQEIGFGGNDDIYLTYTYVRQWGTNLTARDTDTLSFINNVYDGINAGKNVYVFLGRKTTASDLARYQLIKAIPNYVGSTLNNIQLMGAVYQCDVANTYKKYSKYSIAVYSTYLEEYASNADFTILSDYSTMADYSGGNRVTYALPTNNTREYTPTSDYHPSTKKYTDDTSLATVVADKLTGTTAPTTSTVGYVGQQYTDTTNNNQYVCTAVDTVTPEYTWVQVNGRGSGEQLFINHTSWGNTLSAENLAILQQVYDKYVNNEPINLTVGKTGLGTGDNIAFYTYSKVSSNTFYCYAMSPYYYNNNLVWLKVVRIYATINNGILSDGQIRENSYNGAIDYTESNHGALRTNNTKAFTPTDNYNPATKKYVDDQVGAINTILATLTTPTQGGN